MMFTVPPGKSKSTDFQEHLNSIDPHIKSTIELPGIDGLPFLDTLTKHTPNSIESTVYSKPTHTDRYLAYNSNHAISAKLSVIHTLIHIAKQVCSTSEFLAKEMDNLHKVPWDNNYPAPAPSCLYSCIQKIQFHMLRKLTQSPLEMPSTQLHSWVHRWN